MLNKFADWAGGAEQALPHRRTMTDRLEAALDGLNASVMDNNPNDALQGVAAATAELTPAVHRVAHSIRELNEAISERNSRVVLMSIADHFGRESPLMEMLERIAACLRQEAQDGESGAQPRRRTRRG